jgi:hypothetical protein
MLHLASMSVPVASVRDSCDVFLCMLGDFGVTYWNLIYHLFSDFYINILLLAFNRNAMLSRYIQQ